MANQVDFKILPSDQFNVYSPQTRSDKIITYFTLLSKLRGDILAVGGEDDPNDIVSAFYTSVGGTQTLHLVKADGSEVTASVSEPATGTVTSVDLTAGTGISVSGGPITTSGSITVTNTAPDQVVSLTGAGTTVITGTYPSFTITSNDEFDGTVTSVGTSAPLTGGTITTTGTIGITQSGVATDGYLSSTDWNTFNSKEPALTKGNLTEATSSVLTITGGTGAVIGSGTTIQVSQAGASASGFLSSTDWNTFNNKQGTITLTTTGSTGAATFIGNTLNIPNYADQFVGTVTNVAALTLGTTGTDLSSSVVNSTTTPVITLNVPTASATNRGALSFADWTTFNSKEPALTKGDLTEATSSVLTITSGTGAVIGTGTTIQVSQAGSSSSGYLSSTDWTAFNVKQSAITLTTTGTSGVATLIGATLNIPDYSEQYSGTVTSVSTTAPITGGTITNTGTIGITQAGGSNDGYLSSADWTTFNSKQSALTFTAPLVNTSGTISIPAATSLVDGYLSAANFATFNGKQDAITLTTTGTSGAATLVGATLNIPQYTDQFTGTVTSVAALTLGTTGTDLSSTVADGTTTPVITLNVPTASAANRGALSSTDWTTFNSKQSALTFTSPLVNTTNTITINQSSSTTDGYLSSTDWTTFNGKASNSFTTIAVSGQSNIVADTATDTLTIVAGAGISLTTNDSTDTLTITNTAATNIACFAAYTTQNLSLTTTEVEYQIDFDVESITNASFFTHSTTVDPEEITVLVAGKYEISMGYVASNGNSTIATVQGYVGINGFGAPSFSFLQLNTSAVGQYVATGFNTYIYDLDANDVITAIFFPTYVAASTGTITINPTTFDGSTYITIKKIG
jgi:hypothetical protein